MRRRLVVNACTCSVAPSGRVWVHRPSTELTCVSDVPSMVGRISGCGPSSEFQSGLEWFVEKLPCTTIASAGCVQSIRIEFVRPVELAVARLDPSRSESSRADHCDEMRYARSPKDPP